jgi:hypothetical protein
VSGPDRWTPEDAIGADVWPPVLGVDPGGSETGVCLRAGSGPGSALVAVTIGRHSHQDEADDEPAGAARYAGRVVATCRALVAIAGDRITAAAVERGEPVPAGVRVAVEALMPAAGTPRPAARRPGRPVRVSAGEAADVARAAVTLGAVAIGWPTVLVVRPRAHDRMPMGAYPPTLIGSTPVGWPRGASRRSHQRAAWMVAGWAHLTGSLVEPARVEVGALPAADDLAALAEAAARRERARAQVGRADVAQLPPAVELPAWGDAVAGEWAAVLGGPPLPADGQPVEPGDVARLLAAAEVAWSRVGPPPAGPGAPSGPAELAVRLVGRWARGQGWPDQVTAEWQTWLRGALVEVGSVTR